MTSIPESCDLLIEAGYVVPIEPHAVVLEDHAVAVRGSEIVAVLPTAQARARFAAARTVSRPDAALLPGLVNAHTHNPMTLLRGIADDLPLMVWLQQHIWPVETAVIGAEFVADGTALAIAEMLRGGTTCANENYFFSDVQAAVYKQHGFRARVGTVIIDFPTAWAKTSDEYFERACEVHDQWRDDPLIGIAFAPHAPYTVNDANFERVRMLSDQLDVPVHLHTHETAQEIADSLKQYGQRPLARLDRLGLVNDRLIAVHMTQLTDAEIHLCAERGVSVVHCPESNLKLASGFCPACALQRAGVNLAIGTDGCASNNDLDMFSENRTAAILAKAVANDATALDAATTLRAATLGGARALGFGEKIGSIEVGKQADLICVDLFALETQPLHNVLSQLVYAAGRQQVSDVWIAGQRKLEQRVLVDMDTDALVANARQWRERIRSVHA
ncbi:TRZ/ATZ family hydrolase [Xanthomonas graminis]|jgi:5-methylthioadenosine/S-adenosylhomocysteine deaminase|uniref:N-ethylammeline chlorohydrolase n=1 Tax=Xanthomonas graminis pv. graminis TaxID=134874 RepID=A0A1M4IM13_9XANT|nr:TRZ/ATZ family hydrolase [Xanthomonas translucens]EKU24864.1 Putative amidohydrolase family protein [Xanthomonas translucens pv. graminis ART-Xtg29]OAX60821.1 N-ethylammeline chlorohydrolase [Xanthomonas translucens pv. graminis]UKE55622.1 TRZ/ATZ family hydrolase [Xanthomonas translucens pv. graminis]WIH09996.1 TRZ/ATZ family hydrolase [Xanthomonas translucens pv. graminis]WIH11268.1 TRZ/ATZ family hydrolase [Xanthomonas translucens pv. graminis]